LGEGEQREGLGVMGDSEEEGRGEGEQEDVMTRTGG